MNETIQTAFVDELEKISAQKSRKGSTPIRAAHLAGKQRYDGRSKKLIKLSGVLGALKDHWKILGTASAASAGTLGAKQGFEDWNLGRKIRKQHGG